MPDSFKVFRILLDPNTSWELIVKEDGEILIAAKHGEDRYTLAIGHMGCAGIPSLERLFQNIQILKTGGYILGKTTLN